MNEMTIIINFIGNSPTSDYYYYHCLSFSYIICQMATAQTLSQARTYELSVDFLVANPTKCSDIAKHLNSIAPSHGCADVTCNVSTSDDCKWHRHVVRCSANSEGHAQALGDSLVKFAIAMCEKHDDDDGGGGLK
jgi:hypothetical protein